MGRALAFGGSEDQCAHEGLQGRDICGTLGVSLWQWQRGGLKGGDREALEGGGEVVGTPAPQLTAPCGCRAGERVRGGSWGDPPDGQGRVSTSQ